MLVRRIVDIVLLGVGPFFLISTLILAGNHASVWQETAPAVAAVIALYIFSAVLVWRAIGVTRRVTLVGLTIGCFVYALHLMRVW